jgi:hypothetical protein
VQFNRSHSADSSDIDENEFSRNVWALYESQKVYSKIKLEHAVFVSFYFFKFKNDYFKIILNGFNIKIREGSFINHFFPETFT